MYYAFAALGAGRGYNEAGPQPLSLVDVLAYMDEEGVVERSDRRLFTHFLRVLDGRYIRLLHDKISADRERRLNEAKSSGKVSRGKR